MAAMSMSAMISAKPARVFMPSMAQPARRSLLVSAAITQKITKVEPQGDRVFIKVDEVEEKSAGGILLPTSAVSKPSQGSVVAVGPGRANPDGTYAALTLKAGDRVTYSKYAGTPVDLSGADHLIVREDDVLGVNAGDDIATLKPINDRILVKIAKTEDTTSGGVLLTDAAKEKPQTGTVVAAGAGIQAEGDKNLPLSVKAGDQVLYSKYAGSDFKGADGESYIVLRAQDVLAVIA